MAEDTAHGAVYGISDNSHLVPDTNARTDMFLKALLRYANVADQNARRVGLCWQAVRLVKRPLSGWASKTT